MGCKWSSVQIRPSRPPRFYSTRPLFSARHGYGDVTILDILITNDDGFTAPGIRALARKLAELGDVTVVAPAREMSAVSHALTISEPVRFERTELNVFSVEGTPADCVNLAIGKILPKAPDIVVSGINRGANVGDDIAYSGTVAGAREAAMLGVPSVAVSLASRENTDYSTAAAFAAQIVPIAIKKSKKNRSLDSPQRTFLNVNVPSAPVKGVRITTQGHREYWAPVEEKVDTRSRVYFWLKQGLGGRDKEEPSEGISDIHALRQDYISVTPLQCDFTNHDALEELHSWNLTWNGKG